MLNHVYSLSLILILVVGFTSSSLISSGFAEIHFDTSDHINLIYADQTTIEERNQQIEDRLEEEQAQTRDRIEERNQQIEDRLEEEQAQTRDRIEERNQQIEDRLEEEQAQTRDRIEERNQQIEDRLEEEQAQTRDRIETKIPTDSADELTKQHKTTQEKLVEMRAIAQEKANEKRDMTKDQIEEKRDNIKTKLERKLAELKEQAKEKQAKTSDNVQDRKEKIKNKVKEKLAELKDVESVDISEMKSNIFERHHDLQEKFQTKKYEIKIELKNKANEKWIEIKEEIHNKRVEVKEKIQVKKNNVEEFREITKDRDINNVQDKISFEIMDKVVDAVKDKVNDPVNQKLRENIKEEIYDLIEYRADLIKSKINEIGNDKFREIVLEYKQQFRDEAKERIDTIRDKVRSSTLIDQVEDGSYYGDVVELFEVDITNYVLNFKGNAFSTSDVNNVKPISGDVNLELVRLGDSIAILKIIGGQIVMEDSTTGELYNVHDVSFGRSRANLDNGTLQVTINTVDVDGQPHTFAMQTRMDGVFPTDYGQIVDIYATDGKSKSGTAWILDFVGTVTVDEPVPITIFEDVEELSMVDDIVEKSTDDCYDLTLFDFYSDADLERLTVDELVELEEDLLIEVCSEVTAEVKQDVAGDSM